MSQEYEKLSGRLEKIIAGMQNLQAKVAADKQPVSMHEVDELKRLGEDYSRVIADLAVLNADSGAKKT